MPKLTNTRLTDNSGAGLLPSWRAPCGERRWPRRWVCFAVQWLPSPGEALSATGADLVIYVHHVMVRDPAADTVIRALIPCGEGRPVTPRGADTVPGGSAGYSEGRRWSGEGRPVTPRGADTVRGGSAGSSEGRRG